jgi:hypothetical protein
VSNTVQILDIIPFTSIGATLTIYTGNPLFLAAGIGLNITLDVASGMFAYKDIVQSNCTISDYDRNLAGAAWITGLAASSLSYLPGVDALISAPAEAISYMVGVKSLTGSWNPFKKDNRKK